MAPTPGKHFIPKPDTVDPDKEPPKFSLRYMVPSHCVTDCEKDEKAAFVDRLRKLSDLTWSELRQAGRHGLGYEIISRESLRVPVPNKVSPDVKFIAFRFSGLKAMVGYRQIDGTLQILWVDRNFTVYTHG